MKKLSVAVCLILCGVLFCGCSLCSISEKVPDILRIHVRANSNSAMDQYAKFVVKDKVIALMGPSFKTLQTKDQAIELACKSSKVLEEYSNHILESERVLYHAKIFVGKSFFDEKEIDGQIFPQGMYDSLIIELGSACGNNWWGLLFPNFSFLPAGGESEGEIIYKSKIAEILGSLSEK